MGRPCGAGCSHARGIGYGVVEAVVEASDGGVAAGIIEGAASMMTVRVLVEVLPQVSVAT